MMTSTSSDPGEVVIVLVELGLVEQRYQAVLEVLNNAATVTEVAVRFGVTRQSVHRWLRRRNASLGDKPIRLLRTADGQARLLRHLERFAER